jgi:DNA invertase Pin-like site-specific DNA recombinase
VWKLDRLARSIRQLIETVEDLERRKIGLRSLTEAIDTTTPGGRLVFHVFAALAEFERSVIRERTAAGLEAARARGRKGGRPRKMTASRIRMAMAAMADPAAEPREIARELGVTTTTLYEYVNGDGSPKAAAEAVLRRPVRP